MEKYIIKLRDNEHPIKQNKIRNIKDRQLAKQVRKTAMQYVKEAYKKDNNALINEILKSNGKIKYDYQELPELLAVELDEDYAKFLQNYELVKRINKSSCGQGTAQSIPWQNNSSKVTTRYRGIYTGSGVKVAILDSGYTSHEDLPPYSSYKDFADGYSYAKDINGHGNFITGLIAGKDNDLGYFGVAPNVQLYIGRVIGDDNTVWDTDFVAGIDWAISNGVDIINASINVWDDSDPTYFLEATRSAYNSGILVFSCSGNGTMTSTNPDWDGVAVSKVYQPAADYSCIAIGSVDQSNNRSSFSNYGTELDFVSYGEGVVSTSNSYSGYWYWDGTSFATAMATGHASALMSKYPTASGSTILQKMRDSALNMGNTYEYGSGIIMAEGPDILSVTNATYKFDTNEKFVTINAEVSSTDVSVVNFNNVNLGLKQDSTSPYSAKFDTSSLPVGQHIFRIRPYTISGSEGNYYDLYININKPPVSYVNITSPSDNYFTNGSYIAITARIDGYVDFVNFYNATKNQIIKVINDGTQNGVYQATIYIGDMAEGIHEFNVRPYVGEGLPSDYNDIVKIVIDRTSPIINASATSTTNSITVSWNASDNLGFSNIVAYLKDKNGNTLNSKIDYNASSSYEFTGLTLGTDYKIEIYAQDKGSLKSNTITIPIKTQGGRPANWEWTTSKTQGQSFNITAIEWNNFCTRINDFLKYKLNTTTTFTSAVSGQQFKATQFNQAKNAIGGMNPTGIADKSAGQSILASDLNTLRDKLNGIT